jgi:hypothetical protein
MFEFLRFMGWTFGAIFGIALLAFLLQWGYEKIMPKKWQEAFIWKMIKKTPEIIGVGAGMGLLSIGIPAIILELLAPNYGIDYDNLILRWAGICVVLTFVYYWNKEKNKGNK